MIFFVVAAVLTIAVIFVLLRAMTRRPGEETGTSPAIAVYKAQMAELDRDADSGLIPPEDANAARIELSRRLIAENRGGWNSGSGAGGRAGAVFAALVVALPLAGIGLYAWLGTPGMPDMPLADRVSNAMETQDIDILVAQVERHLADNPADLRGWSVVAPVYLRMGRFDDAVIAFSQVNRLGQPTAESETGLGEALVGAAEGVINDEARAAFQRALLHQPDDIRARFFLAVADEQDGDGEAAAARWRELLDSPGDPSGAWRDVARRRLAALQPQRGPERADIEAAAEMDPDARRQMIRSMVEGLAERLRTEPADKEGWVRLIRSYTVLGETEAARQALADAEAAFADDAAGLSEIRAAAVGLGVVQ